MPQATIPSDDALTATAGAYSSDASTVTPRIVVSRCLGFDACRWNGEKLQDPFVDMLRPHVEFIDTCPESDIGLGVPRHPIRIVGGENETTRLVQPATGADVTDAMHARAESFAQTVGPVDGFLLKYRSPSCGPKNVRVYRYPDKPTPLRKGAGLFAEAMERHFIDIPIEDEGRLHHFRLREHWLTRVYCNARLRRVESVGEMRGLVDFHAAHKFLLMGCNEAALRDLGRVVASGSKTTAGETISEYAVRFRHAMREPPGLGAMSNVLQHMFGFVSKQLEARERSYFLDLLEEYRRGSLPISVPMRVLKGWAIRFETEYILQQAVLSPFPDELIVISDSGQGRDVK